MATKLGNDYRLWIESGTPGNYNMIKGQQDLSYDRSAQQIDTSTKDAFPYATSMPGLFGIKIKLDGIADLPDTNGFTLLETSFKSQSTKKFQIRKGGAAGATPADVVFESVCSILSLPIQYGQNNAVKYSTELSPASAPITDTLS